MVTVDPGVGLCCWSHAQLESQADAHLDPEPDWVGEGRLSGHLP